MLTSELIVARLQNPCTAQITWRVLRVACLQMPASSSLNGDKITLAAAGRGLRVAGSNAGIGLPLKDYVPEEVDAKPQVSCGGRPGLEWQQQRSRLQAAPLQSLRAKRQQRLQKAREDMGAHAWKVPLLPREHIIQPLTGGHGQCLSHCASERTLSAMEKESTSSLFKWTLCGQRECATCCDVVPKDPVF